MIYTTQARIEGYLNRALTAAELVNIDYQIASVSKTVARHLNRIYLDIGETDTDDVPETTRYYDGRGGHELFLDDFISISSIELLDGYGDTYQEISLAADYILNPTNETIKSNIYLRHYSFPRYESRVKVTGKFTSGVLPEEVAMLVTAIVANNLTAQTSGSSGEFEAESIEGYSYKRAKNTSGSEENSISQYASVDHLRKITF